MVAYRNRFVEAGPDDVRWRTMFGRERRIAHPDIIECRMLERGRWRRLKVGSSSGEQLVIYARVYPVAPLISLRGRTQPAER